MKSKPNNFINVSAGFYVWGSPAKSGWDISEELRYLNVSHTIKIDKKFKVVNLKQMQPKPVHITDDVHNLKAGGITFVVASYAELALTNYPEMVSVAQALTSPVLIVPSVKKLSVMDYVNSIAKPSALTHMQTMIHRIQPYSLRKSVQQMLTDYLKGKLGYAAFVRALKRSYKTVDMVNLISGTDKLKQAISELSVKTPEQLEAEYNIPAFEIRYVMKGKT